jgi:hypothetical protein
MKIYIGRQARDTFRRFIPRLKDKWLLLVHGVNIEVADGLHVEPVYIPFFTFKKEGGQVIIDLHWFWSEEATTILLMEVPPYIWVGRSSSIRLQNEEEDE